jgi:hypothetical protein
MAIYHLWLSMAIVYDCFFPMATWIDYPLSDISLMAGCWEIPQDWNFAGKIIELNGGFSSVPRLITGW